MANNYGKEKLVKVGKEGFAMVDERLGRRKAAGVNAPERLPPPPPQVLWEYPNQPQETHDMDCKEAAKIYGGMLLPNYPKRKPMRMAYPYQLQESHAYVVTKFSYPTKDNMSDMVCYKAAQIFGGTMI